METDEEPVLDFMKACVAIAAILSYSFFVLIILQCYSAYYFWCLAITYKLDPTLMTLYYYNVNNNYMDNVMQAGERHC